MRDGVGSGPLVSGAALAGEVTTPDTYVVPAAGQKRFTVAALDLGIKARTPAHLAKRGIEVLYTPYTKGISSSQIREAL